MAKIDKLGRVVVPKEYRRKLGISAADELDLQISGGDIIMRLKKNRCIYCQGKPAPDAPIPLCGAPIALISEYGES